MKATIAHIMTVPCAAALLRARKQQTASSGNYPTTVLTAEQRWKEKKNICIKFPLGMVKKHEKQI
jgi:hypothetical protein